jgi:hypothetical protein
LPDRYRLPLVDLAMPALRQMSLGQYQAFRAQVEMLIGADNRLSLFQYVLGCVLHRHLDAQFYRRPVPERVWKSPQQVAGPMSTVLSLLAWEGDPEPGPAAQAFAAGMEAFLGGKSDQRPLGREQGTLAKFDAALQELNKAVPGVKRRVAVACASRILADDQVTVREVEVLRAICDGLDCPMPPLLVGEVEMRRCGGPTRANAHAYSAWGIGLSARAERPERAGGRLGLASPQACVCRRLHERVAAARWRPPVRRCGRVRRPGHNRRRHGTRPQHGRKPNAWAWNHREHREPDRVSPLLRQRETVRSGSVTGLNRSEHLIEDLRGGTRR